MQPGTGSAARTVDLVVAEADLGRFFGPLRRGFPVAAPLPSGLADLLSGPLKIGRAYARERIQTVFLNGRAVDDIRTALVNDGDTVTLSAAMPGLVGATLRKGGRLADLRGDLSYRPLPARVRTPLPGVITVKLFNLVCVELGPAFLSRGLMLSGACLQALLEDPRAEPAGSCLAVRIDGKEARPGNLAGAFAAGETVRLVVKARTRRDP